ncbi:MAG: Uma2 family endonuclease [Thermoanaerobacteraceae bacterium]|nr:Uma2 family endonuclease [Thermoanaerobacteraceae bacterium]
MEELKEAAFPYTAPKETPAKKISFEEFLAWYDEDIRAEWVDGEVIFLTPASLRHQEIKKFLCFILDMFVRLNKLGRVVDAPFLVHLPESLRRGREPDVLFVKKERLHLLKETYLDGPPDLVVEITSPESFARDRGEKYLEYEAAGVSEYWLIDPERQQAEFYRLGPDNRYHLFTADEKGVYRAAVLPGFWLKVDWLWQEEMPLVIDVLREMKLFD